MTVGRIAGLVSAALVAACSAPAGGGAGSTPSTTGHPTAVATAAASPLPPPTGDPAIVREIDFGEPIWSVVAAGETVWVEAGIEGEARLVQLDATTGAQMGEVPGGSWPSINGDALWYMNGKKLIEADAGTGKERAAYETGAVGTAVSEGVQWTASEDAHLLTGVDLARGRTLVTTKLPPGEPKGIQPWNDAVWVFIDGSGGTGLRVDAETGKILGEVDAGSRPHSVALGFGSLWVTDHGTANLYRFAPNGTLEATIAGPGLNVAIAIADDAVWAAGPTALFQIDPATNQIVAKVALGPGDWYGMAYAARSLWVSAAESNHVVQVRPPT